MKDAPVALELRNADFASDGRFDFRFAIKADKVDSVVLESFYFAKEEPDDDGLVQIVDSVDEVHAQITPGQPFEAGIMLALASSSVLRKLERFLVVFQVSGYAPTALVLDNTVR